MPHPNEIGGVVFEFNFKANYEGQPEHSITFTTSSEDLPNILEDFEQFLKGCGFIFNGRVDIVDEEE